VAQPDWKLQEERSALKDEIAERGAPPPTRRGAPISDWRLCTTHAPKARYSENGSDDAPVATSQR
jgi:hypothetical protein